MMFVQEQCTKCLVVILYLHLGKLGSSSAGHLGHTELRQFVFQVVQLLEQLLLLLAPQVSCLNLGLDYKIARKLKEKKTCQNW